MKDAGTINITAEPQINPDVCRFRTDYELYDGVINCTSPEMAEGSRLLEALFEIAGVSKVMVAGNIVTVVKSTDDQWQDIGKKIGAVMREKISAGGDLISGEIKNKKPAIDEKLREKIRKVFDEEINPGIAAHGGSVELVDLQETTVYLTMRGGCQGCASAAHTLKYGIEQILRSRVPEITEIVDVTDHASGQNPYLKAPAK
jgi:Fe-S cluster biogenesis protein NfuA